MPLIIISNFVPSEATVGISKENVSDFYEYFKTERNFTPSFQTIKGPDGIIIFSAFLINSGYGFRIYYFHIFKMLIVSRNV